MTKIEVRKGDVIDITYRVRVCDTPDASYYVRDGIGRSWSLEAAESVTLVERPDPRVKFLKERLDQMAVVDDRYLQSLLDEMDQIVEQDRARMPADDLLDALRAKVEGYFAAPCATPNRTEETR